MANSISLKFYKVQISVKKKPTNLVFTENSKIADLFKNHIESLENFQNVISGKYKINKVQSKTVLEDYVFFKEPISKINGNIHQSGRVVSGNAGVSSNIMDVLTGQKVFDKEKHHAELIPYYYYLHSPSSADVSILCLQTYSGKSVYNYVKTEFELLLKKQYPQYTINLFPISVGQLYIKEFKGGNVKALTCSTNKNSKDKAGVQILTTNDITEVKPFKRNGSLFPFNAIVNSQGVDLDGRKVLDKVNSLTTFHIDEADFENVSLDVQLGTTKRKMLLNKDFGNSFDITETIVRDIKGLPKQSELDRYAKDFVRDSIRPLI